MDAIFSPEINFVTNLILGFLMAKGIIDTSNRDAAYQLINNALAVILMSVLGISSMYFHAKSKSNKNMILPLSTGIGQASTAPTVVIAKTAATDPGQTVTLSSQTGLPISQ